MNNNTPNQSQLKIECDPSTWDGILETLYDGVIGQAEIELYDRLITNYPLVFGCEWRHGASRAFIHGGEVVEL